MSAIETASLPTLVGGLDRPVIVVRHGLIPSHYDREEFSRIPNAQMPLMPEGRAQGEAVCKAIGKWLAENNITSADVWASSYRRPQETFEAGARFLGIPYDLYISKNLREAEYGIWDGKSFDQIDREFPGMRDALEKDPFYSKRPGGESKYDTMLRGFEFMQGEALPVLYASCHDVVIIFTHSTTMRTLAAVLAGKNEDWVRDNKPKNCEAWLIEKGEVTVLFPGFDIPKREPALAAENPLVTGATAPLSLAAA